MTLVCFDWDGTIADTWPLYLKAAESYCAANDLYSPCVDELRESFGNKSWAGIPQWHGDIDVHYGHRDNFYTLLNKFEIESETYCLAPGMADAVRFCAENGWIVAIITSRPRATLLPAVAKCGWDALFLSYVTSTCAREGGMEDKPSPDMIRHMMARHGQTSDTTIMVGDTTYDIDMANAAGCRSIAVTWGAGRESDLASRRPTHLCITPDALKKSLYEVAAA